MSGTNLFQLVLSVLMAVKVPLALMCFVAAGLQLRAEGGVNYDANGGFFKWLSWGAVLLTLPQIMSWLSQEGFVGLSGLNASATSVYTQLMIQAVSDFAYNVIEARLVPIIAGSLVLKGLLDAAEGHSPLPSIISALFLLGISGFFLYVQNLSDTTPYATVDLLGGILTWAMTSVAPMMGVICIYGAILQFLQAKQWGTLLFVGMGFMSITGIWSLVQSWAGVSLT